MISAAFSPVYEKLGSQFENATGHKLITARGPSMGDTPAAIPNRLRRGESADIVILAAPSLETLLRDGHVVAASRVDLARSSIGLAIKAGAPRPDIATVDALKQTLLKAKSVVYSGSASGVYLATELFPRLGIADAMQAKSRKIEIGYVAEAVARGEAEIALQQISELLAVPGIDLVGPLPDEVQLVTVFSAAITTKAREPEAAKALILFLTSPQADPVIRKAGLEPAASRIP